MGTEIGALPGLPARSRSWVMVALLVSTGALVLTPVLLTYLPVDDFAMGFQLDPEAPALSSPPADFERAAYRFEHSDPVADATSAIGAGDTRLWAVKSHDGWFVPGGVDGRVQYYRRYYGLRFYQAGSYSKSAAEEHFLQAIDAYAERYNSIVIQAVRP